MTQRLCEMRSIKTDFHQLAHRPNCTGAGTLIPIKGMTGPNERAFVCRKESNAWNMLVGADAKMRLINLCIFYFKL